MKILVFSDSHASLRHMRAFLDGVKPDAAIHLGDYYDDAEAIAEEYPNVWFYQVSGNCDEYRRPIHAREILVERVLGVDLYMTHGHRHRVKQSLFALLRDARACGVSAVLYGHTHEADCTREADGLWVLNPGSCGYFGGSAGLMEIENKTIRNCRILRQEDLEGML